MMQAAFFDCALLVKNTRFGTLVGISESSFHGGGILFREWDSCPSRALPFVSCTRNHAIAASSRGAG